MPILRQMMKSTMAAVLPQRWLLVQGHHLRKNSPARNGAATLRPSCCLSLTFDDGPHPEHTPRLLDALAAAGFQATFFVIGERARRYPHLVHRIVEEGHELGNHTFTHSEPRKTSSRSFLNEIHRTRCLLQDMTGQDASLVRPPKGKLTVRKCLGLWQRAETIVLWSRDAEDFAMKTRVAMDHWLATTRWRHGDIVLMHDKRPYAQFAVEELARNERYQDMNCVPVSSWLLCASDSDFALTHSDAVRSLVQPGQAAARSSASCSFDVDRSRSEWSSHHVFTVADRFSER